LKIIEIKPQVNQITAQSNLIERKIPSIRFYEKPQFFCFNNTIPYVLRTSNYSENLVFKN
jgi:hypothetical protein